MAALFAALSSTERRAPLQHLRARVRARAPCSSRCVRGQRPMHVSRTSAHEQGAAAQAHHSRRRHTIPNAL
eukprot:4758124-Prymnesium_polylepis.2